ncbi:hypothetical protein BGZ70_005231 [Mortierella alpina]|uniref:FAD-binding domain-containing protein n=1 Tax=Mortierella alpina TaxID=64518 RepID=A0A9P6J9F4_MORAP|nr:hypothetical protein BGZ70_005231 [Mortierella alpina]
MSDTQRQIITNARVLIVGAGIGGLTLAAMLEKAGIEYVIFERYKEVQPLGSALSIGANVMPLFEQLGILEEVLQEAKPFGFSTGYNEQRVATRTLDYSPAERIGGYLPHIVSRPDLYNILLKLVPSKKILMSKKVLALLQNKEGALVRCSDNSTFHGDIVVGADGAYSAVRQSLYKHLDKKGELPRSDNMPLPFNSVCLVGQTRPLDPEMFPHLKDNHAWFETTIGDNKPYAVSRELDSSFRNSEWGPEAADAMCKEVRDFPIPRNTMTMGDLIDATPKEYISKVMLEEKLFDTWHGGRTCLIGDACHKMYPSAGLGAVSAIHDAVALANCIYELPVNPTLDDIKDAFKLYKSERYPLAKTAYDTSHRLTTIIQQNWYGHLIRAVMKYMPKSIFTRSLQVMYAYRPQASFLPLVEDRGQNKPAPQLSLIRARANRIAEAKVSNAAATTSTTSISTTTSAVSPAVL